MIGTCTKPRSFICDKTPSFICDKTPCTGSLARGNVSCHHGCGRSRAATFLTVSDLSNDIGLGDGDARRSAGIVHDHKAYVRVA